MVGGHGDADRGRGLHLLAQDIEGQAHRLQRSLGQLVDGQLIGQSGQQDGEFVPAHPGHRVLAAHRVHQSLAHLSDQVVAGGMPQGVVDRLEVVEVHEEHADRLTDPAGPDQLLLHPVLEEAAVGQPGEGVVPCHVGDLLEQRQVLQGGGRLVGQTRQPLVEVGIVDGGRGAVVEVGGDHAEQLTVGDQRHHQRRRGVCLVHQPPEQRILGRRIRRTSTWRRPTISSTVAASGLMVELVARHPPVGTVVSLRCSPRHS